MQTQPHRRRSAICVTSVLSCFQSLSQLALHFSSLSCTCNLTSNAFTLAQDIVPQRKTCCKNTSFTFTILNREVQLTYQEKDHSLFPRFILFHETPPTRKYMMRVEDWRNAKTSEAKTNSFFLDIAGRGRNFAHEFVPMTISRELFIFSEGEVSRHSVSVRQDSSRKPENQGSTRFSSENLGRKEYELRMSFCSANFEESRVTYCSEDSGDLSLRDACLGKPRSTNNRSFVPSKVGSKCKGDNGKGMKGGHKEGTEKVRKVRFTALMDTRHIQKYEYILEKVRKSNLKCGKLLCAS